MIHAGLVSITFRKLTVERIVELARAAGLRAIEWGGDVHVPHGDVVTAERVRRLCADSGIDIYAYGSYYRAGGGSGDGPAIEAVLETALALATRSIRVWAGEVGSERADAAVRQRVADDLAHICDLAARQQVNVALEYHSGTLTDTPASAVQLLQAVGRPNLRSYWQPRHGLPLETHLADIEALRPYLDDVHVFHWWPDPRTRLALADGADRWQAYLRAVAADGRDHIAALEFVRGDEEVQLLQDAATLNGLLKQL